MPIVWPKFQKCPELFIKFQKCPNLCGKFQKCPNLRQKCQFCPNISRKFHFCPKLLSKFQKRQRSMFIPASSFGDTTIQTIQTIVSESLKCEAVGEEGLPAPFPRRQLVSNSLLVGPFSKINFALNSNDHFFCGQLLLLCPLDPHNLHDTVLGAFSVHDGIRFVFGRPFFFVTFGAFIPSSFRRLTSTGMTVPT